MLSSREQLIHFHSSFQTMAGHSCHILGRSRDWATPPKGWASPALCPATTMSMYLKQISDRRHEAAEGSFARSVSWFKGGMPRPPGQAAAQGLCMDDQPSNRKSKTQCLARRLLEVIQTCSLREATNRLCAGGHTPWVAKRTHGAMEQVLHIWKCLLQQALQIRSHFGRTDAELYSYLAQRSWSPDGATHAVSHTSLAGPRQISRHMHLRP